MALPVDSTRYILTLSVRGGWPDESLVPRPDDMERELRAIFGAAISVQAARTAQNPGANVRRYYELEADSALTPIEIKDMLVVVVERIGAGTFSGQEVQVALATGEGTPAAQGTAKPQPR
jgi:hypothetical protein